MAETGKKSVGGRPKGSKKLTKNQVERALRKNSGLVFRAARDLKICAETLRNYMNEWPDLRDVVREERGLFVDEAQTGLAEAVAAREKWAIIFALRSLGKNRGFGDQRKIVHEGGKKPIQISTTCEIDELNLSVEARKEILAALEATGNDQSNGHVE